MTTLFGNYIVLIFTLVVLTACEKVTPIATKENVKYWSHNTLMSLTSDYPDSFIEIRQSAVLSKDFNFPKGPEDFGEKADNLFITESLNASLIRDIGLISIIAEHCGLDWNERNFLPMMQWQRNYLPENERKGYKIYVIGVSHGFAMGTASQWIEENPIDCKNVKVNLKNNFFSDVF